MTNLDSILKSRDVTLPAKVCLVKAMVFPVVMYGFESWTIKKDEHQRSAKQSWCFWAVVLEKTLESPLDSKEFKPVNPKGNQSWYSLEGLMLKVKLQYFGHFGKEPTHSKNPDVGKDWRQEEKGTIDAKMVGWHHQLDGHEFEQGLGIGDGQESLPCFSP